MTSLQSWGGVLALVAIVLAIGAYAYPKAQSSGLIGSATACTDGYTCFTNLEVQGLQIVDATSTLADTVNFTNAQGICINFYATSSATIDHLVASTTGALPGGAAGVMTFNYGACAN